MIVATAGHVDHGKTSLVKALTGVDTDRLEEEKRRGLTIDLGFAYREDPGAPTLGFVDVPGHIRFISNMLAGVSGIDHALLIVAADDGPMPQTREHLDILDLLGIDAGTIAITKIDRVSAERLAQVMAEVRSLMAGRRLAEAALLPVSSVTGEGVAALLEHLRRQAAAFRRSAAQGYFRLAIDRCFSIKGSGLVVTGSIVAGQVRLGDDLMLAPARLPVRVRGLQTANHRVESAGAGERCAINLTGSQVHREQVRRGDWLTHAELAFATRRADCRLRILEQGDANLHKLARVHVHAAAAHTMGHVVPLESATHAAGSTQLVQLVLDQPLCLCQGDRFILRDQSAQHTLGGGRVIDPFALAKGRTRPERLAELQRRELPDPAAALQALLQAAPQGVELTAFARARNLLPETRHQLFGSLVHRRVSLSQGRELGFQRDHWDRLKQHIREQLVLWHQAHPGLAGIDLQGLRGLLGTGLSPAAVEQACADLITARQLARAGTLMHVPGHTASLGRDDRALLDRIRRALTHSGAKPPVIRDLAHQLQLPEGRLEEFIKRAVGMRLLIRATANRVFLPEQIEALRELVGQLQSQSADGLFAAADYRNLSGLGRNLAIEVLEYFDHTGYTQRVGDRRRILKPVP